VLRLLGHTLIAPRAHREQVTTDFKIEEYLALQHLVYRVGEAIRQELSTERLYIMSVGSQILVPARLPALGGVPNRHPHLGRRGFLPVESRRSWWQFLPFLLLTLLFLALPALLLLIFGKRGRAFLPKARDWMNTNSWVISEIVLVFFILITINSLAG
jgi:hypothetical protein